MNPPFQKKVSGRDMFVLETSEIAARYRASQLSMMASYPPPHTRDPGVNKSPHIRPGPPPTGPIGPQNTQGTDKDMEDAATLLMSLRGDGLRPRSEGAEPENTGSTISTIAAPSPDTARYVRDLNRDRNAFSLHSIPAKNKIVESSLPGAGVNTLPATATNGQGPALKSSRPSTKPQDEAESANSSFVSAVTEPVPSPTILTRDNDEEEQGQCDLTTPPLNLSLHADDEPSTAKKRKCLHNPQLGVPRRTFWTPPKNTLLLCRPARLIGVTAVIRGESRSFTQDDLMWMSSVEDKVILMSTIPIGYVTSVDLDVCLEERDIRRVTLERDRLGHFEGLCWDRRAWVSKVVVEAMLDSPYQNQDIVVLAPECCWG